MHSENQVSIVALLRRSMEAKRNQVLADPIHFLMPSLRFAMQIVDGVIDIYF